jgi:ABC-2 type transport system ATP-binding protein
VSLSAGRGEVLGLLGPNGAGKTTLIRVLATLLRPDSGRVYVGGHDVVADPVAVRSFIGLAGQLAAVDGLLTGRENLDLVGRLYGLDAADRQQRTAEILDRVDLADVADRRVDSYSGGMRRRLDLAATLVGRPAVLLLDEPTTGLDPRSRVEVWQHIETLAAEGTTVVLTSQHLDEVERLADRIVVLDRGRVIADGSPDDLKRQVGGDVIEVRVTDESDLSLARDALEGCTGGRPQIEAGLHRATVPTGSGSGTGTLVAVGRRLEEAGVELDDLGIRRPSLDDVFFSLTGGSDEAPALAATGPAQEPGDPLPVTRRPSGRRDVVAVTSRSLRRLLRTPQLLFFALVQPVIFVVGLLPMFGELVEQQSGDDYLQFLLSGVLVMSTVLSAGSTGVALAEDLQTGVVDRFRSLPMARHALLVGRTLADLLRNAASMVVVLLVGFAMGFRFQNGVLPGLAALGLILLFGYALSWVFAAVGLAVRDVQTAQFIGFAPVLPLVFLSGVWIPVEAMAAGLQGFATHQPINVTLEAVRSLVDEGGDPGTWVVRSVLWSVAILAVFVRLSVKAYSKAASR